MLPVFEEATSKLDKGEPMALSTTELEPMELPTLQEVNECRSGTLNLEATLRSIAERFNDRPAHADL
jgi:hypothetical protein